MELRYQRYKRRFWAVYEGDDLLCVTVYQKGARAVVDRIRQGAPEGRSEPKERPEPCGSTTEVYN
jgi:hypothetical protein